MLSLTLSSPSQLLCQRKKFHFHSWTCFLLRRLFPFTFAARFHFLLLCLQSALFLSLCLHTARLARVQLMSRVLQLSLFSVCTLIFIGLRLKELKDVCSCWSIGKCLFYLDRLGVFMTCSLDNLKTFRCFKDRIKISRFLKVLSDQSSHTTSIRRPWHDVKKITSSIKRTNEFIEITS